MIIAHSPRSSRREPGPRKMRGGAGAREFFRARSWACARKSAGGPARKRPGSGFRRKARESDSRARWEKAGTDSSRHRLRQRKKRAISGSGARIYARRRQMRGQAAASDRLPRALRRSRKGRPDRWRAEPAGGLREYSPIGFAKRIGLMGRPDLDGRAIADKGLSQARQPFTLRDRAQRSPRFFKAREAFLGDD